MRLITLNILLLFLVSCQLPTTNFSNISKSGQNTSSLRNLDASDDDENNRPPIARAGSNLTINEEGSTGGKNITLDGSYSMDIDGSVIRYSWSHNGVVISNSVSFNFFAPVGETILTLTVMDDDGAFGTDQISITVIENNNDNGDDGSDNGDDGSDNGDDGSDNNLTIFESDFEEAPLGVQIQDWFDTQKNNSMAEDDSLFEIKEVSGNRHISTSSADVNIHSHFMGLGSPSWGGENSGYEVEIDLQRNSSAGIGITFYSDYNSTDKYYRLRAYSQNPFELNNHGNVNCVGSTISNVMADPGVWYRAKIKVEDLGSGTAIKAEIIRKGSETFSGQWDIDCVDSSQARMVRGTIGLWSMNASANNPNRWDNIKVSPLKELKVLNVNSPSSVSAGECFDISLNTSSNRENAFNVEYFSEDITLLANDCQTPLSSISMPEGQSAVSIKGKILSSGNKEVLFYGPETLPKEVNIEATPGAASQIELSGSGTINVSAACSSAYTVSPVDDFGNISIASVNINVSLASNQNEIRFFSDANCQNEVSSASIQSGSSEKEFYIKIANSNTSATSSQINASSLLNGENVSTTKAISIISFNSNFDPEVAMRTTITDNGITWTFASPVLSGKYITGHYWVKTDGNDPVQISDINPRPSNGRHGSFLNPKTGSQGFDSRTAQFDSSQFMAPPFSVSANNTLVSTISNTSSECVHSSGASGFYDYRGVCIRQTHAYMERAATLTFVSEVPHTFSFRPPASGTDKVTFSADDVRWELLQKLPILPHFGIDQNYDYQFHIKAMGNHYLNNVTGWQGRHAHNAKDFANYHREVGHGYSEVSALLMLDLPNEELIRLTMATIQRGIEEYHMAKNGNGHSSFFKMPIAFAARMLNDQAMKDFFKNGLNLTPAREDAKIQWASEYVVAPNLEPYRLPSGKGWTGSAVVFSKQIGNGYEVIAPQHWDLLDQDQLGPSGGHEGWKSENYRICCDTPNLMGMGLLLHTTGAHEEVAQSSFFAYVNRFMNEDYNTPMAHLAGQTLHQHIRQSNSSYSFYNLASPLVKNVWNEYYLIAGPWQSYHEEP